MGRGVAGSGWVGVTYLHEVRRRGHTTLRSRVNLLALCWRGCASPCALPLPKRQRSISN